MPHCQRYGLVLVHLPGPGDRRERAEGDRTGLYCLLNEPVEEHPSRPGAAPVEPERELVQIRLQVVHLDRTLVGAEQATVSRATPPGAPRGAIRGPSSPSP